MKQSKFLAVLLTLQVLILLGQWVGPGLMPVRAADPGDPTTPRGGGFNDPGAQRAALIEEAKGTNARLDRLITLLESGKLQVHAILPDDKDKAPGK